MFWNTQFREQVRGVLREMWRDGKGPILLTVSIGWFLSIGVRYMYPSVLPFLRDSFGMGLTTAGMLLSMLWVAYALGQFPGGILGDKIGEGNVLVVSSVISTVAILLITTSINIVMLFIATAGFGFATALYAPHRFTIFTDIYSRRSGTAVGITMAIGSVGNTVLPALAVAIAGYTTWRLGFGILVPVFILVTLSIYIVVPKQTSSSTAKTEIFSRITIERIAGSVVTQGIPVVVLIHILVAFVSTGFLGFYPTYLIEIKGLSPQTAAFVYGSYFVFGVAIQPLVGILRDRFGSRWTLTLVSSMLFVGLSALQVAEGVVVILLLTGLISHRSGVGVVTNTYIADALDHDIKGSGLGLLRTSWLFIGGISPMFVGFLGEIGQLEVAFMILAGVAGFSVLLTLLGPHGN